VPSGQPLTTTVVTTLGEHARAWDLLVDRSPVPSPFLRSWWLSAVASRTASHLLLHDDDGHLAGALALTRDRQVGVPRLRFAGAGVLCPDHLDLLAQRGSEDRVGEAAVAWLTRQRAGIVDLTGLVQGSLLARHLERPVEVVDVAPYAPLPVHPEEFLATLSSSTRRSARRADRRLGEAGAVHRRIGADALPAALADFRRLHEARPDRAPLLAELPTLGRALAAGLAAGEARVDVLENDGRVSAVCLAFVVGGRLSLYQVARSLDRRDDSAGTVLLHRVVADAVRAGCHEVDLLRGDEAYKSSLATDRRTLGRIRYARGPLATGLLAGRAGAARLRRRLAREPSASTSA
jgi:CelD/BcsL family acetyltransferase involved in cellulose biosynthesis